MAGLCAALAAARQGIKVVLMHDRPVLGGNASSECRVHICGADRHNKIKNMRETGILEEIRLDNLMHNPNRNFSVWDTVLYNKVITEPNITLLLNCSCLEAEMSGNVIKSVTGWQLTTETLHTVKAEVFADCSGDSILAPLSGAEFRTGREAADEFNESIAPEKPDNKTMGMTCLFQAKKCNSPQKFTPPDWAEKFESCEDLPYGSKGHKWFEIGYWWVELGGNDDSIHDTEEIKHKLLKIVYGVWDHLKNHCAHKEEVENWALDWIQFLPAKRESRRYVGPHIINQNDIEAGGDFEDIVAYGGWPMDDHHPDGFYSVKSGVPATVFNKAPSPYGIPFRCLYSKNVENLMFAGRNISATHAAMSSTRLMGTGCSMGQAVGTAASLCINKGLNVSDMSGSITELQQLLLDNDAYIPGVIQQFSNLTIQAKLEASQGDPEPVRDGTGRPVGDMTHSWEWGEGDWISYSFEKAEKINTLTLIMDSGLDQSIALSYHQSDNQLASPPDVMPEEFVVEGFINKEWQKIIHIDNNCQRFQSFAINNEFESVRVTLKKNHGKATKSKLYSFYLT
ncbi:MAG: FAD-dependent oxidoreductase [Planctomycetota bacterium]|jgi:hypothetical protein